MHFSFWNSSQLKAPVFPEYRSPLETSRPNISRMEMRDASGQWPGYLPGQSCQVSQSWTCLFLVSNSVKNSAFTLWHLHWRSVSQPWFLMSPRGFSSSITTLVRIPVFITAWNWNQQGLPGSPLWGDFNTQKFWKIEQVFLTGTLNLHNNSIFLMRSRIRGCRETSSIILATQKTGKSS